MNETTRHRSIWISDTHIGTKECRADLLLDFLNHNDAERRLAAMGVEA